MKWIKSRESFLNEAKIRDVIFARQSKAVADNWGEKYLDYEEVEPTKAIKQGSWKLSEEDKLEVLSNFCNCNMGKLFKIFTDLSENFNNVLSQSIKTDLLSNEDFVRILSGININKPKLDQILILKEPVFRKLSVTDTMKSEVILKDENGRPIKDENGQMIKTTKNVGDLVFSNNLINIYSFIEDFNDLVGKCVNAKVNGYKESDKVDDISNSSDLRNFVSYASGERNEYKTDLELFNRDMYLKINHNPKDILNMSISRFYASCQHLYSGSYREQLLSNVFDPNSIPAFLVFDTPIFWEDEKISDHLPIGRMMIRSIVQYDENAEPKIFFDRAYYERLQSIFEEIVTKYSGNVKNITRNETYIFAPDLDLNDDLSRPYMDKMDIENKTFIGVNTKTLHLNQISNWKNCIISPKAKIKELIIETTVLPENLLTMNLNLDWIKFRYIEINTLVNFDKIKTESVAFDKCKFNNSVLEDINAINDSIKKIQIVSCDTDRLDFSQFKNLEELQLIYTLDSIEELNGILETTKLKTLVISGDLAGRENKKYISSLRQKGIKVNIVGPTI